MKVKKKLLYSKEDVLQILINATESSLYLYVYFMN